MTKPKEAETSSNSMDDVESQKTLTIDNRRKSIVCIVTLNRASVPGYSFEGVSDECFELDLETIELDTDDSTPACNVSPMNSKYSYREHVFIIFCATILSFNSGFSNGVCLSGFLTPPGALFDKQSTSGFTGVYTGSALALADGEGEISGLPHVAFFGFQVSMILSFIGGSCLAAFLNPRTAPWRIAPMYAPTFFIGGVFMTIAAIISSLEASESGLRKPHFFFFVAAANGIQNGLSSMYSANLIRTTHLTGTSTDIGLFLGQLLRGNTKNTWKLWILLVLAFSFWIGSFVSFFAVKAWTTYTLLFNAGIFWLIFLVIVSFIVTNLHLPIFRAFRGTWHWQRTLHRLSFRAPCGTPKPETTLMQIFDKMDTDGDGYIDVDQLYKGLEDLGMKGVKEKAVKDMFRVCDRDMDGKICASDWNALISGENVLVG